MEETKGRSKLLNNALGGELQRDAMDKLIFYQFAFPSQELDFKSLRQNEKLPLFKI